MTRPGADPDAVAVLERLRQAEAALAPLAASDVPFIRHGVVAVLVQLRELRAFVDVEGLTPYAVEFE